MTTASTIDPPTVVPTMTPKVGLMLDTSSMIGLDVLLF